MAERHPEQETRIPFGRPEWFRRQFIRELLSGKGWWGIQCSLIIFVPCSLYELGASGKVNGATFISCATAFLLSFGALVHDVFVCLGANRLGLLRRVAIRCRAQMRRMGVVNPDIFRFIEWLLHDPALESHFQEAPFESVQMITEALDRLTFVAERYESLSRHVFEANARSVTRAVRTLRVMPGEVEPILRPTIGTMLQDIMQYDPEGWSLAAPGGNPQRYSDQE